MQRMQPHPLAKIFCAKFDKIWEKFSKIKILKQKHSVSYSYDW